MVSCGNGADFLLEGHREPSPLRAELSFCRRSASKGAPATVLRRLRVLGQLQVHEMRFPLL